MSDKRLPITMFSGKRPDWNYWKILCLETAHINGFKNILMGTVTVPKENEQNLDDEQAKN